MRSTSDPGFEAATERRRIRTALFVDFDNMFGGLLALDRTVGLAFAESPEVWLTALQTFGLADQYRDVLLRRVYLNPAGWISDSKLGNDSGRLYLQKFRPYLTQAGFEVVDCPALTRLNKNAADIRIVIDVLESLNSNASYDEFIIASSDADFTPLLQKLRAADRRTVIMSASTTSPAYRNIAHVVLEAEDVSGLFDDPTADDPTVDDTATGSGRDFDLVVASGVPEACEPDAEAGSADPDSDALELATSLITKLINESKDPVLLSSLGQSVREALKSENSEPIKWFGHRSMSGFVSSINDGEFEVSGHFVWKPGLHKEPAKQVARPVESTFPATIERLCKVADLPRISSGTWSALLQKLIEYADGHDFNLTRATAWTRDELADTEHPVARQTVAFAVRGLAIGGASLAEESPPDFQQCVDAVVSSVSDRATATGWELSSRETAEFRRWLSGDGSSPP